MTFPDPPTPNRRIRVFVSSTFRDMTGERDELMTHAWPELRLDNLSKVMRSRWRFAEAAALSIRAVVIYDEQRASSGHDDSHAADARSTLTTNRLAAITTTIIRTMVLAGLAWLAWWAWRLVA